MRELALADLDAYRQYLDAHPGEWAQLDELCRISISRFYRDRGVFHCLRHEILPTLAADASAAGDDCLQCWSAGSASGEEAYTLGIMWKLEFALRFPELKLQVIATDSDPHMLDRARQARYPSSSLKDLPREWLTAFDICGEQRRLKPEFRAPVEFRRQDLRRDVPEGRFHLVLCRYLAFTYFDTPLQKQTLQRILETVRRRGILVTGKQEALPEQRGDLEEYRAGLGVYRKRDDGAV